MNCTAAVAVGFHERQGHASRTGYYRKALPVE